MKPSIIYRHSMGDDIITSSKTTKITLYQWCRLQKLQHTYYGRYSSLKPLLVHNVTKTANHLQITMQVHSVQW